jgi:hypothetical protein
MTFALPNGCERVPACSIAEVSCERSVAAENGCPEASRTLPTCYSPSAHLLLPSAHSARTALSEPHYRPSLLAPIFLSTLDDETLF